MNLQNAECLFSDMNGRVAKLRFDAVFGDLIKFFRTTPVESKATAPEEEKLPEPEEAPARPDEADSDILILDIERRLAALKISV